VCSPLSLHPVGRLRHGHSTSGLSHLPCDAFAWRARLQRPLPVESSVAALPSCEELPCCVPLYPITHTSWLPLFFSSFLPPYHHVPLLLGQSLHCLVLTHLLVFTQPLLSHMAASHRYHIQTYDTQHTTYSIPHQGNAHPKTSWSLSRLHHLSPFL
jgi:hypothetical protein